MTVVNAFNWKAYTDEQYAKHGDPFKDIKRSAIISANVTEGIYKIRKKNPSHGTIFGLTEKRLNIKEPEMMGGARPNSGRKLPAIDVRGALALLDQGLTKKQIAEKFGIPYKSMLTFFKKSGKIKTRGEYAWTGKYKGTKNV